MAGCLYGETKEGGGRGRAWLPVDWTVSLHCKLTWLSTCYFFSLKFLLLIGPDQGP